MHWAHRLNLPLATIAALLSSCSAQEVASVDLTAVEARVDLRRPKATSETTGGHSYAQSTRIVLIPRIRRAPWRHRWSPWTVRTTGR